MEWQDIADIIQAETGVEYKRDFLRRGVFFYELFNDAGWCRPPGDGCPSIPSPEETREQTKERMKLQTEKLEYNRWLRANARDDLLIEKLYGAIQELRPLPVRSARCVPRNHISGTLLFGDEHFGSEFEIKGLYGETINRYDVEIAQNRMWEMLDKTIALVHKEGLSEINVFSMGDFTDGVLRVGQLPKLQYGVVDSTVIYMEFLASWLDKLTEYVNVNFQMVHGNHSELRMLGQKKGAFQDENMGKIVASYIKARLSENPNFTYVENPTGLIFADVSGFNLLGIHGECKNMERALKDFSMIYQTPIHFLCGGHLHHSAHESTGYKIEAVRVPSIVGADPFSMSIRKTASAGATFLIVEENVGKVSEHFLHLN